MNDKSNILDRLYSVIESHKIGSVETSYTAKLFSKGLPVIAEKVGEESIEIIVAALIENEKRLIEESADLLYHLLVLWAKKGIKPDDIWEELCRREGTSGIEEKGNRIKDKRRQF